MEIKTNPQYLWSFQKGIPRILLKRLARSVECENPVTDFAQLAKFSRVVPVEPAT